VKQIVNQERGWVESNNGEKKMSVSGGGGSSVLGVFVV